MASQALEAPCTGYEDGDHPAELSLPSSATSAALEHPKNSGCTTTPPKGNVLVLPNISPSMTYRTLHLSLVEFGTVLCIKLVYDDRTRTNNGYITFSTYDEAKAAYDSVPTFSYVQRKTKANLMRSNNLNDDDDDYYPNIFAELTTPTVPRLRKEPPPSWFVAFYKDGRGNYFRAVQSLEMEFGKFPEGHLKQYGKGVLIRAKTETQSQMLLHQSCPSDSMFEAIKPHRTFNYSKGCVYNYDLYELSEEEILNLCPDSVHKISKIRSSRNMVLLTFFGSFLPDSIRIGPLHLRVRPFLDRPLQCYGCYKYGHGKKNCTETPRCGNCSALDSHPTDECESNSYCFYCRDGHPVRSRQCSQYRLEQDILHLANTQFISLGSARRELHYRHKAATGVTTYASSLGTRSSAQSASVRQSSHVSSRPLEAAVTSANRFSPLSSDSNKAPLALSKGTHFDVHASSASPNSFRRFQKRNRGSSESVDSATVPPNKVSVSVRERVMSQTKSVKMANEVPVQPADRHSVLDPALSPAAVPDQVMETEASSQGGEVAVAPRQPQSSVRSDVTAADPTPGADSRDKFTRVKSQVPQPGPSRVSISSSVRPSGLPASRRLNLKDRVGKGKSLPGTPLKPRPK